ncbi:WcaI family glycosyltransferase [Croceicoccus bisphenolivorans]|uniref:WcaI family glycosyltransferase n=1 Tax=Croceicoccus bisphenolivorans TaxID=1783232 RepID=UPI00083025DE|nr:WcaI family glycosyltransferase [Croceicoccus bisphenolivorans]
MQILIVGLNYAPEPIGIGPYTTGLAEGLVARGHTVQVIAGLPYYPQWQPYDGQPRKGYVARENGVTVTRVRHYIPARPSGPRRILHHLSFALSARGPAMRAARGGIDAVIAIAPSLLSVPVARAAARLAGAPLWVHVQDFEAEAAVATGMLRAGSAPARLALNLERDCLISAAKVSTISPQMRSRLHEKGIAKGRVVEMRNWFDPTLDFANADVEGLRARWGLTGRTVALYSGNIANKQGLDIVIEAARAIRARSDIAFVICGEGPNRATLQSLAQGLDNVQFRDLQPRGSLAAMLALADIHLLPQLAGAADLVLPSKLTNMLASGRPMVATAAAGTGLFDEVEGCGLNVEPGNAAALADAICALANDPALRQSLGDAARRRAAKRWSYQSIIDTAEATLTEIGTHDVA